MKAAMGRKGVEIGSRPKRFLPIARRWARLFLGILLIWAFMFIVAPLVEKAPVVGPMIRFIEENGIDASALYYTEIEEFSEAGIHMGNTMKFPPRGL
jgi:hypothetical protein